MDRKEFIKKCGFACLGGTLALLSLENAVAKHIVGKIIDSDIVVPLKCFFDKKKDKYRKYIVVEHKLLRHPIYVFRTAEAEYSAVLMQCTHQGAELQAFGDTLECPAHGSRFNQKGIVEEGPASRNLRSFPIKIDKNKLKISLRK